MKRCHSAKVDLALFFAQALVVSLAWPQASTGAVRDTVRVENGLLSGATTSSPEIRVFKGIPFAAPPVGELRWKAPQPVVSWQGVRDASQFAPMCLQEPRPARAGVRPMSEDCLYINVWTGAQSANERRPVMVRVHGGGFRQGSGSNRSIDGEALAKKGVVLVTFDYRLGVFGFFAHPELTKESGHNSSGNYGLLDQIAALEWVKKNIAAFGGDPHRVTIFGESAGSFSVNFLMATPLAKGLFHRAIGESGAGFARTRNLAEGEQEGKKFAESIGVHSVQELRAKPAVELQKAGAQAPRFSPSMDGWMLPEDVYSIFAHGKQNDVPLIAGWNADEGTTLGSWPANKTAADFIEEARRDFGERAGQFLTFYPAGSDQQARASHFASFRDMMFGWPTRTWVRLATTTGKSKAYLYYFTRVPPGPNSARLGAFHAAEVFYVFNNLRFGGHFSEDTDRKAAEPIDPSSLGPYFENREYEDTDRKLADQMSSYWVNFAAGGDPNGKALLQWPAYGVKTDIAIEFGDEVKPRAGLYKHELDFLDGHFAALRSHKER